MDRQLERELELEKCPRSLKHYHWTWSGNVALCVIAPLLAVTVTAKLPIGVPVEILKFVAVEGPPPGPGFVTTTGTAPTVANWLAVGSILIWLALRMDPYIGAPPKVTVDEFIKFEPLIVIPLICDPAAICEGLSDEMEGTGLGRVPPPPPPPPLLPPPPQLGRNTKASTNISEEQVRLVRRDSGIPMKHTASIRVASAAPQLFAARSLNPAPLRD